MVYEIIPISLGSISSPIHTKQVGYLHVSGDVSDQNPPVTYLFCLITEGPCFMAYEIIP